MYEDKKYFPKAFIAKGNKLFGVSITDEWGDKVPAWELETETDYGAGEQLILLVNGAEVADITLKQFPGCCGVVVLTELDSQKLKKGYGEFVSEAALYYAANIGYTLVIATTVAKNKPSNLIAQTLGATQVASFSNRKTKNVVKVWTKTLPPKSKLVSKYV